MDTKNKDNLNEVIWVDLDLKAKTDTIISILIEAHHEARLNKVNFNLIEILIIKIKGRCLLVNITMATLITKNNKGKIWSKWEGKTITICLHIYNKILHMVKTATSIDLN